MELDLHGKTLYQARVMLDAALRRVSPADYRLKVIHGHVRGTAIRDMLREEYLGHPKVRRMETTPNPGETILVLREY